MLFVDFILKKTAALLYNNTSENPVDSLPPMGDRGGTAAKSEFMTSKKCQDHGQKPLHCKKKSVEVES